MRVLVSNDDGIQAPGLVALAAALGRVAETWVVAPDRERSAISHAISLHRPLRLEKHGERAFAVDGTPTDAVYIALHHVLPGPPDVVVSGINLGANLGNDVLYSGTVAAAMEGAVFGHPAMAVSMPVPEGGGLPQDYFDGAASIAAHLVQELCQKPLAPGVVLNVNVPYRPKRDWAGFKLCRLGYNDWSQVVTGRTDPRGRSYYWIGGERGGHGAIPDSDYDGIAQGYITLTPLHYDTTDHRSLSAVRRLAGFDGVGFGPDALGDLPLDHPKLSKR